MRVLGHEDRVTFMSKSVWFAGVFSGVSSAGQPWAGFPRIESGQEEGMRHAGPIGVPVLHRAFESDDCRSADPSRPSAGPGSHDGDRSPDPLPRRGLEGTSRRGSACPRLSLLAVSSARRSGCRSTASCTGI